MHSDVIMCLTYSERSIVSSLHMYVMFLGQVGVSPTSSVQFLHCLYKYMFWLDWTEGGKE